MLSELLDMEEGEQLLPFVRMFYSQPLRAIAGEWQAGERLFAFLDDLYVSCQQARIAAIHRLMRIELWRHSKISVHHGKTKLWNNAGILPIGVQVQQLASSVDEDAVVWRGNTQLQTSRQGIKILGTPIGHEDFVRTQLTARRTDHDVLLDRIPAIPDLQAPWLLLSYCASARAFCVAHCATRVGRRILCFARRSNLEVPHDDSPECRRQPFQS